MTDQVISTGYVPHKFQYQIHRELMRFSVLVCHRRFGKTILAINELVDKGFKFKRNDGRFGYVAPFLKQAKQVAWDYLKRYTMPIPGCHYNESELSVILPTGTLVRLYGADNADAMRGGYFDGVVLDEVADFKPFVWGEVIRPMLADRQGWALFIGTPKGMNLFYELYQRAINQPDWYAGMFTIEHTMLLPEKEIEEARASMSDAQFRQEFLCDFTASVENQLISIPLVEAAANRTYRPDEYSFAPKVLGVDVARFGDDRSVIIRRQGLVAYEPEVHREVDNMHLAGIVAQHIVAWKPDMVFVDGGRGEGVIDRLRQLGHRNIIEVQFGSKARNPRYANKRTEMYHDLAAWLKAGGAIPNVLELKNELVTITYEFDAAGRTKLTPKEKQKEDTGVSPDIADSLAITFAEQVSATNRVFASSSEPQFVTHNEYVPDA